MVATAWPPTAGGRSGMPEMASYGRGCMAAQRLRVREHTHACTADSRMRRPAVWPLHGPYGRACTHGLVTGMGGRERLRFCACVYGMTGSESMV